MGVLHLSILRLSLIAQKLETCISRSVSLHSSPAFFRTLCRLCSSSDACVITHSTELPQVEAQLANPTETRPHVTRHSPWRFFWVFPERLVTLCNLQSTSNVMRSCTACAMRPNFLRQHWPTLCEASLPQVFAVGSHIRSISCLVA